MQVRSRLMWVAGALVALAGFAGCGSNSGTGNTGGGNNNGCVPGTTQTCSCVGAPNGGVQTCNDDGRSYGTCDCGSGMGGGNTTTSSSSSSGSGSSCGDGIIQDSDHCDTPNSEAYCKVDCQLMGTGGAGGTGGACAGHVYYAGKYDGAPSVWAMLPAAGGLTGLDAGNAQCKSLNIGADHVCDYEEVKAAAAAQEAVFTAIPSGTTAWVQRTTTADINGVASAPGPGGRCNNWTYNTNHISDGEYVTFDTAGTPTYHLDNDTIFDPNNPGVHTITSDLQCGGQTRSILCCYQACN